MDPHEYCRQKAAASGSGFYYSVLSLPPERRRALTALRAFCLEVRNSVDEVRDPGVARTKLMWWRDELQRVFDGKARHPVARALAEAVAAHALDRSGLDDVIHGAAMDLEYNAYPDFDSLEVYCRRIGGAGSRLSAKILGFENAATPDYAGTLGIASELTRIIRDVGRDARRGRAYLPLHEMAEFGVTSDDLMHARETDGVRRLIAFQVARANAHFDRALALLPEVDRKRQRPGLISAAIDRALLAEIEADGCHVLTRHTSLTPLRMLWLSWRTR